MGEAHEPYGALVTLGMFDLLGAIRRPGNYTDESRAAARTLVIPRFA